MESQSDCTDIEGHCLFSFQSEIVPEGNQYITTHAKQRGIRSKGSLKRFKWFQGFM